MQTIPPLSTFEDWRDHARRLLAREVSPTDILWEKSSDTSGSLFSESTRALPKPKVQEKQFKLPAAFISLAETAACHRSEEQWSLLYSLLWRLIHGERYLLSIASDPELHKVQSMIKHIRRDCHKMHAFVRFRKVGEEAETQREQFVSWFEPEHRIVRLNASFFRKRFTNMDWSILTPDECMHWDGEEIRFTPGVEKSRAPDSDELEKLWKSYYRSIFNAARLKIKAMQAEMPKKYWKNLPESELISELIQSSSKRMNGMLEKPASPEKPVPENAYLKHLHGLEEGKREN